MKLHTVFITYNRLELTKRAIESYLETVSVPHTFVMVDNGSTDGTVEWLMPRYGGWLVTSEVNHYPGKATNVGWSFVDGENESSDATHLHRADNDFVFLPGWCEEVERMFQNERLGQLGLRTDKEELNVLTNTGGNCVISRKIWDAGVRWDERPWPQLRDEVGAGWTEDSLMSKAIRQAGFKWDRVERPCIQPISEESIDDEYYKRTWADRGINQDGSAA